MLHCFIVISQRLTTLWVVLSQLMNFEKGQFIEKEDVKGGFEARYEENKIKAVTYMEYLRVYAEKLGQEKFSEKEADRFVQDIGIMTDQLRLAIQVVNRRIFDKGKSVNTESTVTDEKIERAQNDIGQMSLIAKDLANFSSENAEVVKAKRGEGDKSRIKLDMENSRMEIVINPKGTEKGQARVAFEIFYKDEYLEELEKEISRSLSLRIDVTTRGIYIDVDSPAIKEVLMVEENGRRFPDYHVKALQELDIEVFGRLTGQVTELLPAEIQRKIEDKVREEMSRQLLKLSELY